MARTSELPPEGEPNGNDGRGMEVAEDGSSLMLCSPLIPQRDSLVEIAETEYVSFDEGGRMIAETYRSPLYQTHTIDDIDEESEAGGDEGEGGVWQPDGDRGEGPSQTAEVSSVGGNADDGEGLPNDAPGPESKSIFRWPWSKTEEEKRAEQKEKEKEQVEAKANEERKLKKNEKLVWVPSPTNISLQTMWWGYRMSVNFRASGSIANSLSLAAISPHPFSRY